MRKPSLLKLRTSAPVVTERPKWISTVLDLRVTGESFCAVRLPAAPANSMATNMGFIGRPSYSPAELGDHPGRIAAAASLPGRRPPPARHSEPRSSARWLGRYRP